MRACTHALRLTRPGLTWASQFNLNCNGLYRKVQALQSTDLGFRTASTCASGPLPSQLRASGMFLSRLGAACLPQYVRRIRHITSVSCSSFRAIYWVWPVHEPGGGPHRRQRHLRQRAEGLGRVPPRPGPLIRILAAPITSPPAGLRPEPPLESQTSRPPRARHPLEHALASRKNGNPRRPHHPVVLQRNQRPRYVLATPEVCWARREEGRRARSAGDSRQTQLVC